LRLSQLCHRVLLLPPLTLTLLLASLTPLLVSFRRVISGGTGGSLDRAVVDADFEDGS
jgi:hypothetical protein